jgi:WD40 repeat protein
VRVWEITNEQPLLTFKGHSQQVNALAWSPNGKEIASGSWDCTVQIWNATTGVVREVLKGHSQRIVALDWSQQGNWLASTGDDAHIRIWDPHAERAMTVLQHGSRSYDEVDPHLTWNTTGTRLASANSHMWSWFDWEKQERRIHQPGLCPTWSFNAQYLAVWHEEQLSIMNSDGSQTLKSVSLKEVPLGSLRLAWHPQEPVLAISNGTSIFLWNVETETEPVLLASGISSGRDMQWDSTGKRIAIAGLDGRLHIIFNFDSRAKADIREFTPFPLHSVTALAWHPQGTELALATSQHEVVLMNAETYELSPPWRGHSFKIHDIAWSPDGQRIATASGDNTLRLWHATRGQTVFIAKHESEVLAVAWTRNGHRLATLTQEGQITVRNSENPGLENE